MKFAEEFKRLKDCDFTKDDTPLMDFFDKLAPVNVNDILSKWHGGDFNNGHQCNKLLKEFKWYGKWYRSAKDAVPMVCENEEGKLYSFLQNGGEASLWNIEFRGKVSATMVYDCIPVFDHLRRVDDNTLMGVMDGKITEMSPLQEDKYYFFYLERVNEFPTEFS